MSEQVKIRLSKLMADQGLCSRREADRLIAAGAVEVNGEVCSQLGTRVDSDAEIRIRPSEEKALRESVTILLNKPLGYVSSPGDDGYPVALDLIRPENRDPMCRSRRFTWKHRDGLAPAGRLDIDSTGLLVLTQDGRVARQLIGPQSAVEKLYWIRIAGQITEEKLELLRHGLKLDGRPLRPAQVRKIGPDRLEIILREGRKRQVRRMCELVELKVLRLTRLQIGQVRLGQLPLGKWRYLNPDEVF